MAGQGISCSCEGCSCPLKKRIFKSGARHSRDSKAFDYDHSHDYSHDCDLLVGGVMQTIQASEFKAKCLSLMDDVASTGEVLVVTKNGKPIAELRPYSGGRAGSPFGLHPGVKILGDIISPVDEDAWEALG